LVSPPFLTIFISMSSWKRFGMISNVCAVKPLVLTYAHALAIEQESKSRGLVVGIEYTNASMTVAYGTPQVCGRPVRRFPPRLSLAPRKVVLRRSNFQNWMTTEQSDAFTYIGCPLRGSRSLHYGPSTVSVSVCGVSDRFPTGKEGYLWTDAASSEQWGNF